jgi:hypothetical protein
VTWTIIGLIVTAVLAIFASFGAPVILMNRTAKMHREDRIADWARQDALAAAAKEAADEVAKQTSGKLDAIHGLVDGAFTAAMRAELDATRRELAMMREVVAIKQAAGHEPTVETLAAIEATNAKILALAAQLADREAAVQAAGLHAPPPEPA